MILRSCLQIAGLSLVLVAAMHAVFPRQFGWREELPRLSLINRQIFLVHCLFVVLVLFMMGVLALFFPDTLLVRSDLARLILVGLVVFWVVRLYVQFFVYSPELWRGHRFNTAMHVFFSVLWAFYVGVFGAALVQQLT